MRFLKMMKRLETRSSVKCAKRRLDSELRRTTSRRVVSNQTMIAKKMEKMKKRVTKMESTKMRMKTKKVTITSDIIWFV